MLEPIYLKYKPGGSSPFCKRQEGGTPLGGWGGDLKGAPGAPGGSPCPASWSEFWFRGWILSVKIQQIRPFDTFTITQQNLVRRGFIFNVIFWFTKALWTVRGLLLLSSTFLSHIWDHFNKINTYRGWAVRSSYFCVYLTLSPSPSVRQHLTVISFPEYRFFLWRVLVILT